MKRSGLGDDLFLAGIMGVWSLNFILTKVGLREIDVLALTGLRNATTVVFLVSLFLLLERRWPTRPADLGRLAVVGLIGVALNQVFYNVSLRYTSAANASLLSATTPIFGLMFARILENERSSPRRWFGVVLALAGVALIVGGGKGSFTLEAGSLLGDLSMLGASASFALFAMLGRPLLRACTPVELTLYAYLIGVPFLIPVSAGAVLAQDWSSVSWVAIACAMGVGINFSLTNVLFYRQMDKVGAPRAMVFMYLVPISGAVLAVIFLSETLSLLQVAGAVVALIGVNTARTG